MKNPMHIFNRMKQTVIIILSFVMLFSCKTVQHTFTVINPLDIERKDELVVLIRADIESKTGIIPDGKRITVKDAKDNTVTVQLDDMNADGKWDEAAFTYSFAGKENAVFSITVSDSGNANATVRAHVRLRKKITDTTFGPSLRKEQMPDKNPPTDFSKQPLPLYLTEGPAWENDKVAFRLYFDTRNGKDIFGKLVPGMVMDTVGLNVNNSYHQLSNWGMDILHAGNSLGAGAIAFGLKENDRDTLIRLGAQNITKEVYEQIADGPVRAIFRITYDWQLAGKPVQVIDETSIWGGQYFYQSKVIVHNAPGSLVMFTGMADFYSNTSSNFTESNAAVLFSYGAQSENHDNLGMAIMVPKNNFTNVSVTPKENVTGPVVYKPTVFDSYLIGQTLSKDLQGIYRFYAAWERSDKVFADINNFKNFLTSEAIIFSHPVEVRW
jgi:hypothetical protein